MPASCSARYPSGALARAIALSLILCAFFPSYAQEPTARDATEGAQTLFRFPAGGVITTGPVSSAGRLWFVSDNRYLYVINLEGVAIGKRDLGVRSKAFIACDPYGRAVVPDGEKSITMVNKAGQAVWTIALESQPAGPPAFGMDGRLYLALEHQGGTRILCLSQNGRRLWARDEAGYLVHPPAQAPGGGVVYALSGGQTRMLDQEGRQSWSIDGQSPKILCSSGDSLLSVAADGSFSIYRPPAEPLVGKLGSAPVALRPGDGGFAFLNASGQLGFLNADGSLAWSVQAGSGYSSMACYRNRVVLLGRGMAASWDMDGRFFRRLDMSNAASVAALGDTGTVFSGGKDWILYAYRFELGLEPLPPGRYTPLSLAEAEAASREAELWMPSASSDEVVLAELGRIAKSMVSGDTGGNERSDLAYAAAVALGLLPGPAGSGARKPGPSPSGVLPRAEACRILGAYGSPMAVELLAGVFARDPDPAVRASAAQAVGAIGLDPGGFAQRIFMDAASGYLDERSALSLIDAVAALYRANGTLEETAGALALVRIAQGSYPKTVRERALSALKNISAAW